ncbi:SURF1 family protein [Roseomonas sp. CCTCC AB2023176]|uniref:SURF1 family protein n=1 Tax=Roseomonas sp. CCTCC AB2023176 TaxID=3342640 RepID=UPI0035E36FF3
MAVLPGAAPGGPRRAPPTGKGRRIWPAVLAAIPVFVILLGLGTWQVQRLHWKTALLADIAAAEAGPPRALTESPSDFSKVEVTGRFLHDREALLGLEVRGATLGGRLVTPLMAAGRRPILVDRGWVPVERPAASVTHPEGEVRVIGFVSPPEPRDSFAARDDTAGRRFYTADPRAIGAGIGLPEVEPYLLVALRQPDAPTGALPDPARNLPRPRNSHLGYAITWYGLAAALVGVLGFWIAAQRRGKDPA